MRTLAKYATLGLMCLGLTAGGAAAQEYPTQSIRLVVPFSPGGSIDIVARLIAPSLSEVLGQPVVIENRTGASGYVGAEQVAQATPDGYTIIMHGLPLATQRHLQKNIPIDPLTAFDAITVVAYQPNVLVVHPEVPANTVQELIDYAKENPGMLNFASSGPGATQHLAGEMLKKMAGIDIVHVPYQGGGASMPDLLAGRVQMMIETAPSAMRYVKSGQLRALGVTSMTPLDALKDVPPIGETLPGFELASWLLLLAPDGTPEPVVQKLHDATVKVLNQPKVTEQLTELGLQVGGAAPPETQAFLEKETDRYGDLIRSVGISPN